MIERGDSLQGIKAAGDGRIGLDDGFPVMKIQQAEGVCVDNDYRFANPGGKRLQYIAFLGDHYKSTGIHKCTYTFRCS